MFSVAAAAAWEVDLRENAFGAEQLTYNLVPGQEITLVASHVTGTGANWITNAPGFEGVVFDEDTAIIKLKDLETNY